MNSNKWFICSIVFLIKTSCVPLELIDSDKSDSYFIKDGKVVFCEAGNTLAHEIKKCDADLNSLEVVSRFIVKDAEYIFFRREHQLQIDYESFYMDGRISKDANNAYVRTQNTLSAKKNVDADSFTLNKK